MITRYQFGMLKPIVLAPMAGGPSTPELCAAVADAGGLPFLAAGYLEPAALQQKIAALTALTSAPFGINLFAPECANSPQQRDEYQRYRDFLQREVSIPGQLLQQPCQWTDDFFAEKLAIALSSPARFISFTFAFPPQKVMTQLQRAGKKVILYATSRAGIEAIISHGADIIGIQGNNAGGHSVKVAGYDSDEVLELTTLVEYARTVTDKPIFAGGGVTGACDVSAILAAGATAVQVGTLFLDATEAGTRKTHRQALRELNDRQTVITRAFSGKTARAITNAFTEQCAAVAPALYPQIHYLTAKLRAGADADDNMENLNLWAGTGFKYCTHRPAADILLSLLPEEPELTSSEEVDP